MTQPGFGAQAPASTPFVATPDGATPAATMNQRERLIFYATNRQPNPPLRTGDWHEVERNGLFNAEPARDLSFGSMVVQAPACRRVGEIPRPLDISLMHFTIYREPTDPRRHFIVTRAQAYASADEFTQAVRVFGRRSAIVFVHGFRNDFLDAAYHLGQIVYDMNYDGVPVLFSWPAAHTSLAQIATNYVHDRHNAEVSRMHFLRLLNLLQDNTGLEAIHVIAHSMGNLVVLDALHEAAGSDRRIRVGELIMAAPDVAAAHYQEITRGVRAVTRGMTLYASDSDFALTVSPIENQGELRAGLATAKGPVIAPGVEAVDVSALGDLFSMNHTAFSVSPVLIADMKQLVDDSLHPPDKRHGPFLRLVAENAGDEFWRYRGARVVTPSECGDTPVAVRPPPIISP